MLKKLILALICLPTAMFGMLTIPTKSIKKIQHGTRRTHTTVHPLDYGINPHSPYRCIKSPQDTLYNINKFLDYHVNEDHFNNDTKQESQKIAKILLHHANVSKKIHAQITEAVEEYKIPLSKTIQYAIAAVALARYNIKDIKQDLPGHITITVNKAPWKDIIKKLCTLHYRNKINKHLRVGVISKKLPVNPFALEEAFNVACNIIANKKEELSPYHNVSCLAELFLCTERKQLAELNQKAEELSRFVEEAKE